MTKCIPTDCCEKRIFRVYSYSYQLKLAIWSNCATVHESLYIGGFRAC